MLITRTVIAGAAALFVHAASSNTSSRFYEDALQRYEKGDTAGAVIQLKNALQKEPKMLSAHLLLGKALLKSGEIKASEAAFEEAVANGVNPVEIAVPLGQVYSMLGERTKLLERIKPHGLPVAQQSEILTMRAVALAQNGQFSAAKQSIDEARVLAPQSAAPLLADAMMQMRRGELAAAKALAQRATELAPANAQAWSTLGSILQSQRDSKGSLDAYNRGVSADPLNHDSRLGRATILLALGRDGDAQKDVQALRASESADPRTSFLEGVLAARKGDRVNSQKSYEAAAASLETMPQGVRNSDEQFLLAGALSSRALGNTEKTREYLKHLLTLNSRHYAGQLLSATVSVEARDYSVAQPILETLLRTNPNDSQALYQLGSLLLAKRQYSRASEMFERAAAAGEQGAVRELGLSQLALGQDRPGLANLERAFNANPGDMRAGMQLCMHYVGQQQADKALAVANRMVKHDPANLAAQMFLGNVKGRVGDKRGARESFQQVLNKDPDFRVAAVSLAWLDIEEKRFDDARKRLSGLLSKDQQNADLLFQMGVLEIRAGKPADSIIHLQRSAELKRSDPKAGLALLDIYLQTNRPDKAAELTKTLAGDHPDKLPVVLAVGRSQLATGDLKGARLTFKDAVRLAEFDPEKQVLVARMLLMAGAPDEASYSLQKALSASPNYLPAMVLTVEVEAAKGNPQRVEEAVRALNAKHANTVPALLTTGQLALAKGQFPAALAAFQSAMGKSPQTSTVVLLAQAHLGAREPDKALAVLQAWSDKRSNDPRALRALAEVQAQTGRLDAAKRSFARLTAIEPNNAEMLSRQALLLHRLKDPTATAVAERALKAAPGDPEALDALGWIQALNGKFDLALPLLREARLRAPNNGEIRFHLAFVLHRLSRNDEAASELRAGLAAPRRPSPSAELDQLRKSLGI